MRQRAALIRTLAVKPKLLLLDEAFSALDYQTRIMVTKDIYDILKNEGITTLMVTHDISESISMSDRIIVMTNRPGTIKDIIKINLEEKSIPTENRKDKMFTYYYEKIWKELDHHV